MECIQSTFLLTVDHQKRKDPCCLVSGFALLWVPKWSTCKPPFWFHLVPVPPESLSTLTLRRPALILPTFVVRLLSLSSGAAFFQSVMDPRLSLCTPYSRCQQNFFSMTVVKSQSPGLSGESATSMVSAGIEYNIS